MDICTTLSRKLPSLTLAETPRQWLFRARDFHCWDHSPFTQGGSSDWQVPCLTSHTPHSHRQTRFPYWIHPRFPITESQISSSIKQFFHGTFTQKQLQLLCTNKAMAGLLYPHSVLTENSCSSCRVLHSCWVSQRPSTWLPPPVFLLFV